MTSSAIRILLSARERKVLLKYGYVNPKVESQIESLAPTRAGVYIDLDHHDIGMITAPLLSMLVVPAAYLALRQRALAL